MNIQQDAAGCVAQEGLASKLWRKAAIACNELETYLAPFAEGDELNDRTGALEALRR